MTQAVRGLPTEAAAPAGTRGASPSRRRRPTDRPRSHRLGVAIALAVAALWTLAPVYWMFATSLKSTLEVARLDPTLWPQTLTPLNYSQLFGGSVPFLTFLLNSLGTSLAAAGVSVLIATFAGYSFARGKYRLRGSLSLAVLATQMLPLVVLIGPMYLLLLRLNLLDTHVGLVLGYTTFGLPFAAWMMKGFIDAIPHEIEEAARVDGCSRLTILFRIIMPLSLPGLLTTGTFVFINSWNNLLYPLTLISSTENQTLPPGLLQSFTGQFKTDWGGMMAAACLTSIPLIVAFFAVQRSMVRGLTAGAVAGS